MGRRAADEGKYRLRLRYPLPAEELEQFAKSAGWKPQRSKISMQGELMFNRPGLTAFLLCIATVALGPCGLSKDKWISYESWACRFKVRRPASWFRFGDNTRGLDIVNFDPAKRVSGVFLPKLGAEITVFPPPSGIQTVSEWIDKDLGGKAPISRRKVARIKWRPDGCADITEVLWDSEAGPDATFVYTGYYCATTKGLFSILLVNWKGSPKQDLLRATALQIAISLRAW
jgi:hypothetical protein